MSSAHAPTEWVVGPGRGEGGMKRQLERFVRARFSFQMPLQSTFFFGQLPGLNFSISALISIRSTPPRNAMGKKSKQKAAQAHAAEQARLQQMSTGGQPSAASSQWDLRPLALKVCMCLMVFLLSFIFFPFFWPALQRRFGSGGVERTYMASTTTVRTKTSATISYFGLPSNGVVLRPQ